MGRRSSIVLESCAGTIEKCALNARALTCPSCAHPENPQLCPWCRQLRPAECFKGGTRCSVCNAYSRGQHLKHRRERNRRDIARIYKISPTEYDSILRAYDNRCAICGSSSGQVAKRDGHVFALHVDHNHQTGAFRGLLCFRCNQILGWIEQSDWAVVLRAKDYVDGKVGPIWADNGVLPTTPSNGREVAHSGRQA